MLHYLRMYSPVIFKSSFITDISVCFLTMSEKESELSLEKNCSWIGGETSAAFSLFAGIIMMKRAHIFIFMNLILVSLVIFCRLAMGGHFLSDNLFAINFMIFLALIYKIIALKCVKINLVSKS